MEELARRTDGTGWVSIGINIGGIGIGGVVIVCSAGNVEVVVALV